MSFSSSSPETLLLPTRPYSPSFSSLPPELIDEILRSDVLSNRDLARCCLVSTTLLPTARHLLYSHLELQAVTALMSTFGWPPSSAKLLRTLRSAPSLGLHTISLALSMESFRRIGYLVPGGRLEDLESVLKTLLHLVPKVRRLALDDAWLVVLRTDFEFDEYGIDTLTVNRLPLWRLSGFHWLIKLRVGRLIDTPIPTPQPPPSLPVLRVLDVADLQFAPAFAPNLSILRLGPLPKPIDLSSLTNLTQLHLVVDFFISPAALDLSYLDRLSFLSFEIVTPSSLEAPPSRPAIESTISSLPLSRHSHIVLRFLWSVPFSVLSTLLARSEIPFYRIQIGASVLKEEEGTINVKALGEKCDEKGIEFEIVSSKPIDVFDLPLSEPVAS